MTCTKVKKQMNFPLGKTVKNISTGKSFKVIGIGTKTAIKKDKKGKLSFVSAKNLRLCN